MPNQTQGRSTVSLKKMNDFKQSYIFFGHSVDCLTIETNTTFKLEVPDMYPYLKKYCNTWKFQRIDTTNQIGFPDILLLKKGDYVLMEAKILKKKQLNSIEDDLKFEFGQIAFMKRSLTLGLSYILVVAKGNLISFIGDRVCLDQCL
jgi:hypothetical protein